MNLEREQIRQMPSSVEGRASNLEANNPASQILSQTIEGAIASQSLSKNCPEAQSILKNHLFDYFNLIHQACRGNWLNVRASVNQVDPKGKRPTALQVSVNSEEVMTIDTPEPIYDLFENRSTAVKFTRQTFNKSLKYLQYKVTTEEELQQKLKKGTGSYFNSSTPKSTRSGTGRTVYINRMRATSY